jgi:hypothetical protein
MLVWRLIRLKLNQVDPMEIYFLKAYTFIGSNPQSDQTPVGSKTIGSNTIGSNTIGSNTIGSKTSPSSHVKTHANAGAAIL